MSRPIYSRHVTRWYYGGKGYATLRSAARAQAKSELRDLVLGPLVGQDGYAPQRQPYATLVQKYRNDDGYRDYEAAMFGAANELYAERFPHGDDCEGGVCWTDERGVRFAEWCKVARDAWINDRAAEIMVEEGKER